MAGLIAVAAAAAACSGSSSGGAATAGGTPAASPTSASSSTAAAPGCPIAAEAGPVFGHWLTAAGEALQKGDAKAGVADLAKAYAPIKRAEQQTTGDLSAALGRLGEDIQAFSDLIRQHKFDAATASEEKLGQDVSTIKALCP